jgi:hypothetical protein
VYDDVTYVYDDVTYVYDDVTYVYDDVTYVYDDVTYVFYQTGVQVPLVPPNRTDSVEYLNTQAEANMDNAAMLQDWYVPKPCA